MHRIQIAPQALQIRPQLRGRLIPQLTILFEAVVDHLLQAEGQLRVRDNRRDGHLVQNRGKGRSRGLGRERMMARGALVKHCAQREQVATTVELFAFGLFRRHVGDRAERQAGDRALERVIRVFEREKCGVSLARPKSRILT